MKRTECAREREERIKQKDKWFKKVKNGRNKKKNLEISKCKS